MIFRSYVVKGIGIAKKKIGIPTINLAVPRDFCLKCGVYACKAEILRIRSVYKGVLYFGPRTFLNKKDNLTLEMHLFRFKGCIKQGEEVKVSVFSKIRDVKKAKTLEELREQIYKDIDKVKRFIF